MPASSSRGSAADIPAAAATAKRVQRVHAEWRGEQRFESGRPNGPTAMFDGHAVAGQSPVDALLSAVAACSGIDVVDILAKRRTPISRLTIDVVAQRREEPPRRVTRLDVTYHIDGDGIEMEHATRAVMLAFVKYCSVSASLAGDIEAYTVLVLNGITHEPVRHELWSSASAV
jgi:putative redox protein